MTAADVGPHFAQEFVGDLFLVDLTVKRGAAAGSSTINLLASTEATDNDTDNLTIFPVISNGADVNDGEVVVTGREITVSPISGLITTEAGGTATFTVVLNASLPPT